MEEYAMKRFCILVLLSACALLSCKREMTAPEILWDGVSATAAEFVYDADTKTVVSQQGSAAPTFAWKKGDQIGVVPVYGNTLQTNFEVQTLGSTPKAALFDGGDWAIKEGRPYAAYYPFHNDAVDVSGTVSFSFAGQRQSANNSLAHIGEYDVMYAKPMVARGSAVAFAFSHCISLLRFAMNMPSEAAHITSVKIDAPAAVFADKGTMTLADGAMTASSAKSSYTLPLDDISVATGEPLVVWLAVLPASASASGRFNLTVSTSDGREYTCTPSRAVEKFIAGRAYSYEGDATATTGAQSIGFTSMLNSVTAPTLVGDAGFTANVIWGDGSLYEMWKSGLSHSYKDGKPSHDITILTGNVNAVEFKNLTGITELDLSNF